jgi:nucleoid-associated protein YgaU
MERTVTVKGGDTLSGIALRELGDASQWRIVLARNKEAIGSEQKRRGIDWNLRYYEPENWIFPGTVLVIPSPRT